MGNNRWGGNYEAAVRHPLYKVYSGMIERCSNPRYSNYYG